MAKASDNVFPRFLISEGGSTSTPAANRVTVYAKADGLLYQKDDAGTETLLAGGASGAMATDALWDAAGDLAQGTGANTGAKLSAGLTGQLLQSAGAAAANAWKYPPGYEFDFAEITSAVNIVGTTEAGATTIITGNAVTYDGSQIVEITFFTPFVTWSENDNTRFWLYDGSSSIGEIGRFTFTPASHTIQSPMSLSRRLTPSNASHTYGIRASSGNGSGNVQAGAGGSGNIVPAYMRITKVSGGA